jgi:hypothetical protein
MPPQCWRKIKLMIRMTEATKLYHKVNFAIMVGRASHASSSSWLPAKHGYLILVMMEISRMKFVKISVYYLHKTFRLSFCVSLKMI